MSNKFNFCKADGIMNTAGLTHFARVPEHEPSIPKIKFIF